MSFEPYRYRSESAAQREAARIMRDIPHARVEVTDRRTLVVRCHPETLTPSQRERISTHELRRPEPPREPLFKKRERRPSSEPSQVENVKATCYAVLDRYRAEGRLDGRLEILDELVAMGVNPSTAAFQFWRYRKALGLPSLSRGRKPLVAVQASSGKLGTPQARRVQNGILEPLPGSVAGEVWALCDALSEKLKRPPTNADLAVHLPHVFKNTRQICYRRWRLFHSIPPQRRRKEKK